jgi:hypothetical protein
MKMKKQLLARKITSEYNAENLLTENNIATKKNITEYNKKNPLSIPI